MASFAFDVRGQRGALPAFGLGTACLLGEQCTQAVRAAIKMGVRAFDTALLYNNQEAIGIAIKEAIAAGEVTREELFITTCVLVGGVVKGLHFVSTSRWHLTPPSNYTPPPTPSSKVAFFPDAHDGKNGWVPIAYHSANRKSSVSEGVALCLAKLQLTYVDLLLIHNACTEMAEYHASMSPHCFELSRPGVPLTLAERTAVMRARLDASHVGYAPAARTAALAATWRAMEAAKAAGYARAIGVSNYPVQLIDEMASSYATVMPAVNQLELHPRYSSPALRARSKEIGMVLTAYGTGNSTQLWSSPVIDAIAAKRGSSTVAVVMRWTLQRGVSVIPRTASPEKIAENLREALSGAPLDDNDLAALDALNAGHPYYWWAAPLLAPGTPEDL